MTVRDSLIKTTLPDGLYAVVMPRWVAGFVVAGGRVEREMCAPILRAKLSHWVTIARRIGE